jgi:hypothetical protein
MRLAAWLSALLLLLALVQRTAAQAAPEPTAPEAPPVEPTPIASPEAAPPEPAPQATEPSAPADDADAGLVAAELAKLGLSGTDDGGFDAAFHISGFADFAFSGVLGKNNPYRGAYERFPSFAVGNFNLYLDKRMTQTLRMFGEVRFTFLPNGTAQPGTAGGEYVTTLAEDYANFKRPLSWGGIAIPRVYLEWSPLRELSFRAGVFLTPYGIWNVDHGSPTVITVQRPFIVGQALFPEKQTGLDAFGQFDVGDHSTIGYHVTLSNGTGAVSDYRDFDANKALGGRLYWTYDGFGELRIGGSGYYGTDSTANEVASLAPDGSYVSFKQKYSSKSDVLALAADVQWKYSGFLLQSELITQQRRFDEKGRVGAINPLSGHYVAPGDGLSWGIYGLLGYRFDWFGVMPYALMQTMDAIDLASGMRYLVHSVFAGLNIRPVDMLVIKLEYNQSWLPHGLIIGKEGMRLGQVQLAWAF